MKVYSPNATWPAVKSAVTGASIVVYLGHGNGWPSSYRDALYPPTQNGFGLNPVAGGDDSTHQYFGEKAVGQLQFASNAVVLLSHLCYASGNTEPGLSEGTSDQAVQRVDNYAAGFLSAGARAVVAEAYLGPAYYVKALLRGSSSIEQIWTASPTANGGHRIAAASARTPGYAVRLDPERASGGFVRSLVAKGLTAAELRAGAAGRLGGVVVGPTAGPSLASTGIRFAEPSFAGPADRRHEDPSHAPARQRQVQADPRRRPGIGPLGPDPPGRPTRAAAVGRPGSVAHPEPTAVADPAAEPALLAPPSPAVDPNAVARFERPNAPTIAPEITIVPVLEPSPRPPHAVARPDPDPGAGGARGGPRRSRAVRLGRGAGAATRGSSGLGIDVVYPAGARPVPAHRHAAHARRRRVRRGHAGHARAGARPRRWHDGRRLRCARDALGNGRRVR